MMMGSFNAIITDEMNIISKDMRKLQKVGTYLHSCIITRTVNLAIGYFSYLANCYQIQ